MRYVIRSVFKTRAPAAIRVATCESTLNPRAISPGGGNWGLFQMNVVHRSWLDWRHILEPLYNTRAAYRLSRAGTNWRPWACQP